MHDREAIANVIAAARACIAATAERPEVEWVPRARAPAPRTAPPAQHAMSQPPPQPPTVAPSAAQQRWFADMMVEVLGRVLEIERHASGLRFAAMEARLAQLEQEAERRTAPALRVVG